jgi:hypothetical protein
MKPLSQMSGIQIFGLGVIAFVLVIGGIYAYGALSNPTSIPTEGTIETTIPIILASPSTIDWGTITVGGSTTKTVTLTNNSTESETITDMTFITAEWANTTDLGLELTWDYTGTNIYAKQNITVTFTLSSITAPAEPTFFNFSIVITPHVTT